MSGCKLQAQVRVIVDEAGNGQNRRHIRRALLVDRETGLLYELPTIYIYRNLPQRSFNTHRAVLRDLSFYVEWKALKLQRNPHWDTPEKRVFQNQLPLTRNEIDDLSRWCQLSASDLALMRAKERKSVHVIPSGYAVDTSTSNSRIRNICNYLVWINESYIESSLNIDETKLALSEKYRRILRDSFEKNLAIEKKAPPIRSLNDQESIALSKALGSIDSLSNKPHRVRDSLILRVFFESGIRAGELLKLQCGDIEDHYEIEPGKYIGLIKVIRRPNDPNDDRRLEPAVKTLPGPVAISKKLATDIFYYIINERRIATGHRRDRYETPYLFVSHSGPNIGKPMSQRNLNRIVAKLKNVNGIPASFSPHVLRHTHFTQLADIADAKGIDPTDILINRGRWLPNSKMPGRYSQRSILRKAAALISERDRILDED